MFKLGDWVQITPTPDLRWNQWYNSRDIYQEYLDKIGVINFISEDEDRPGEFLYAVKVKFPDGLGHLSAGEYYEWFKSDHLIRSSQSTANLRFNMVQAGKELQEWEAFKKKSTHEMLKKVFSPPETKEEQKFSNKKVDDPNQWELKTDPSNNSKYEDDDGYYLDYSNLKFDYDNSTDLDYYYYADTSDAKKDDKD
jgi:hypothetical protein